MNLPATTWPLTEANLDAVHWGGLVHEPTATGINPARRYRRVLVIDDSLVMRRYLEKRNAAHAEQWVARIGINIGRVIGSLVGVQKYVYDLFGPGVNLAARMESLSEPMMITLNQDTKVLLENQFEISDRGEFEVKGFGTQHLWSLEAEFGDRPGRHR